jgi:flagellar biosynthetic protein FliQ
MSQGVPKLKPDASKRSISAGDTGALKEGCCIMDIDQATELVRHTLVLTLIIAAPMLIVGMVVGIVISLVQAVTQIQEQTLTFVPKIASMFFAAIILMPWIAQRLLDYAGPMFSGKPLP